MHFSYSISSKKKVTVSKHYEDFWVLLMPTSGMGIALEFEEDLRGRSTWVTEKTDYLINSFLWVSTTATESGFLNSHSEQPQGSSHSFTCASIRALKVSVMFTVFALKGSWETSFQYWTTHIPKFYRYMNAENKYRIFTHYMVLHIALQDE